MGVGSVVVILSVLGVIGIGAGLLLKYTGVGDVFTMILQAFNTFFTTLAKVFSWAPRWIQLGFFVIIGISLLGFISSWFLGMNYVCASGTPYMSTGFVSASVAKTMPSDTGDSVKEAAVDLDPNFFKTVDTMVKYGTFILPWNDPDINAMPLREDQQYELLVALPVNYSKSDLLANEDVQGIMNEESFSIYKYNDEEYCAMEQFNFFKAFGSWFTSKKTLLASFDYDFGVYTGNGDQKPNGVVALVEPSTMKTFGLDKCPQTKTGVENELLLVSTNFNESGYVVADYKSVDEVTGLETFDAGMSGGSRRVSFINLMNEKNKGSFEKVSNDDSLIKYYCSDDDEVLVRPLGLDLFNPVLIMVIMIMIAGIGLALKFK